MGGLQLEGSAALICWLSFFLITQVHSSCDLVADDDKSDCGYYGIKRLECEYNGCCWAPSSRPNVPWCYHTAGGPVTTPPPRTTPQHYYTTPRPSQRIDDIRLAGGSGPHEGRLEIRVGGVWGTVCDDGFEDGYDRQNARVVCRMLGLPGGQSMTATEFGEGSGSIHLDDVECEGDEESLADCRHRDFGANNCGHSEDVGVVCGGGTMTTPGLWTPGPDGLGVRLVNGNSEFEGRLEIFYGGEWGTVCDDGFENGYATENAQVVCRMLGMTGGEARTDNEFEEGSGTIWLDEVECDGSEASIADCQHLGYGDTDCGHYEDVGIVCSGYAQTTTPEPDNGSAGGGEFVELGVRLVGGTGPHEGRLEIRLYGQWGTVCDDGFEDGYATENAQVVCRMLGLTGGRALTDTEFGEGSGDILLDELQCRGDEASISECSHAPMGAHNCGHYEDVGIICDEGAITGGSGDSGTVTVGGIRLVGGSGPREGRVEIFHDGEWGTVCDDGFEDGAASENSRVICRMLGLAGGVAMVDTEFGAGSGSIWLDGLTCGGSESSLADCSHLPWGDHNCGHDEDVGVVCDRPSGTVPPTPVYPVNITELGVRLVNGPSPYAGRLEIFHNGEWGTVCDDGFENGYASENAQVVCRMLGFSGGEAKVDTEYGAGSGITWLDDVECSGGEASITDCRRRGWGEENCSHDEDVGIVCDESGVTVAPTPVRTVAPTPVHPLNASDVEVRLVNGPSPYAGRLEIFHNGEWGTVCDDGFENGYAFENAQVVCRMLGFSGGEAKVDTEYGAGSGITWLDDVECSGSEASIADCRHRSWGDENCSHDEDVGIVCDSWPEPTIASNDTSGAEGAVRLVGAAPHEGRLEIYHDGEWGTVCDDGFEDGYGTKNAEVVCRMLGYSGGQAKVDTEFGEGSGVTWLDDVECTGDEASIVDCRHLSWGDENCSHGEDVGVVCEADLQVQTTPHSVITNTSSMTGNAAQRIVKILQDVSSVDRCLMFLYDKYEFFLCPDNVQMSLSFFAQQEIRGDHRYFSLGRLDPDSFNPEITEFVGLEFKGGHSALCPSNRKREAAVELRCSDGETDFSMTELRPCVYSVHAEINCDIDITDADFLTDENIAINPRVSLQVRLVGSDGVPDTSANPSGRVEMTFNGRNGTLCDDGFSSKPSALANANVICRQMGYAGGEQIENIYGTGSGSILLDDLTCQGNESHVMDCSYPGWDVSNCQHTEDVALICFSHARLVGGATLYEGRLEIYHDGQWGTVCNDGFVHGYGTENAEVVCRMLGYSGGQAKVDTEFGEGSGVTWLDEVRCKGSEASIADCYHAGWGMEDCFHSQDVGIVCSEDEITT